MAQTLAGRTCSSAAPRAGTEQWQKFLRWGGMALAFCLLGAAVVAGWRRLSGAMNTPLPTIAFIGFGVAMAGLCGMAHTALAFASSARYRFQVACHFLLFLAAWIMIAAAWMPGTPSLGMLGLLAAVGGQQVASGYLLFRRFAATRRSSPSTTATRGTSASIFAATCGTPSNCHVPEGLAGISASRPKPLPPTENEEIFQQLVRRRAADGGEQLAGWVRVGFAVGQRIGNLHLAFCPPFARKPEVAVEVVDGPPARVRAVQALTYGARIEVRLAKAAEAPAVVLLHFVAQTAGEKEVSQGARTSV
jgi:hypothetical protein